MLVRRKRCIRHNNVMTRSVFQSFCRRLKGFVRLSVCLLSVVYGAGLWLNHITCDSITNFQEVGKYSWIWSTLFFKYHCMANKPTAYLMLNGLYTSIPKALQILCHPRDKVEKSHVPIITPAHTHTLQTEAQQRCFAAEIGMVVVLTRSSFVTKTSLLLSLYPMGPTLKYNNIIFISYKIYNNTIKMYGTTVSPKLEVVHIQTTFIP